MPQQPKKEVWSIPKLLVLKGKKGNVHLHQRPSDVFAQAVLVYRLQRPILDIRHFSGEGCGCMFEAVRSRNLPKAWFSFPDRKLSLDGSEIPAHEEVYAHFDWTTGVPDNGNSETFR